MAMGRVRQLAREKDAKRASMHASLQALREQQDAINPTTIRDYPNQILFKYTASVLDKVETLFAAYQSRLAEIPETAGRRKAIAAAEKDFSSELIGYLATNWAHVKGTCLSPQSLPNEIVEQLFH